jgi:hypothetical protein
MVSLPLTCSSLLCEGSRSSVSGCSSTADAGTVSTHVTAIRLSSGARVFGWLTLLARSDRAKDVEILYAAPPGRRATAPGRDAEVVLGRSSDPVRACQRRPRTSNCRSTSRDRNTAPYQSPHQAGLGRSAPTHNARVKSTGNRQVVPLGQSAMLCPGQCCIGRSVRMAERADADDRLIRWPVACQNSCRASDLGFYPRHSCSSDSPICL